MQAQPVRNFTRVAVAIVIAAIVISAAALSYSSFESTVTKTVSTDSNATSTITSTVTTTSIVVSSKTITDCAQGPGITNLDGQVMPSNSTTDCTLGITLGLETSPKVTAGQNGTVYLSITNDLPTAREANYTALPTLPNGPDLSTLQAPNYVLPTPPPCGSTSIGIAIYNGSGSPVQLNDMAPSTLSCLSNPSDYHYSFNASETVTEAISIGGYWTSTDVSEPWLNATFGQFAPGNYTVVAFDQWGQLTELGFTVTPSTPAGGTTVVIPSGASSNQGLNFEPANIHVVIGVNNTIIFTNDDTLMAQVESTSWPTNGSGFETGIMNHNQSWEITLTAPGVYHYEDRFRLVWLDGTIVVEPLPLQLRVSLNTTTIQTGGGILAEVSIFNPLGVNVSVPPSYESDPAILSWNPYDFLCGGLAAANPTWSLAGYGLFQGHYTSGNISSAGTPLNLVAPLVIECPAMANPDAIVFLPHGSNAVAYLPQGNQTAPSYEPPIVTSQAAMNATTGICVPVSGYYNCNGTSLSGYWTGPLGGYFNSENATTSSPYFHYFPPGEYTLVVEDAWGQTYYAYFQVMS